MGGCTRDRYRDHTIVNKLERGVANCAAKDRNLVETTRFLCRHRGAVSSRNE